MIKLYPWIRLVLFLGFASLAQAEIYKCTNANGRVDFTDKPCKGVSQSPAELPSKVSAAMKINPVELQLPEPPRPVYKQAIEKQNDYAESLVLKIRGLLEKRQFAELNRLLASYQTDAEKNIANEQALFTAYAAFDSRDRHYARTINDWIKATPDAYQPYVARAYYYYGGGWAARGYKYRNETGDSKFTSMRSYFSLALKDIEQAMNLNSRCMVPYFLKIGIIASNGVPQKSIVNYAIAKLSDEDSTALEVVERALEINPATFYIRAQYLNYLDPRWGGSYEEMQSFINESLAMQNKNPRLKWLEGYVAANQAHMLMLADKHKEADDFYKKALIYGNNPRVLYLRANNSYYQGDYEKSMRYYNEAIRLYAEDGDYFYRRAKAYRKLMNYQGAMEDIKHALLFNPESAVYLQQREKLVNDFLAYGKGMKELANPVSYAVQSPAAGEENVEDASHYFALGKAAFQNREMKAALVYIQKAIAQDPTYFDAYVLNDRVLMISMQWDQIISSWNQYIELEPDNAQAYLERGGAYFHKGDIKSSMNDAKTAADLGSDEGRKVYQQLQNHSR